MPNLLSLFAAFELVSCSAVSRHVKLFRPSISCPAFLCPSFSAFSQNLPVLSFICLRYTDVRGPMEIKLLIYATHVGGLVIIFITVAIQRSLVRVTVKSPASG